MSTGKGPGLTKEEMLKLADEAMSNTDTMKKNAAKGVLAVEGHKTRDRATQVNRPKHEMDKLLPKTKDKSLEQLKQEYAEKYNAAMFNGTVSEKEQRVSPDMLLKMSMPKDKIAPKKPIQL